MRYYLCLTLIFFLSSCNEYKQQENDIIKTGLSKHPYWGLIHPSDLSNFDTIKIPIEVDASIFIEDISELETNKSDFIADLKLRLWSSYQENEILESKDTIILAPNALIEFDYRNTENLFHTDWVWDGFYESLEKYRYVKEIENKFYHKWDLRKYPFDQQKIRFSFTSKYDTSFVRIKNSKNFLSDSNRLLPNLKDGFTIDTIVFKEEFIKSEIKEPFDKGVYEHEGGLERNEVKSRGVFEVLVSRQGSWLFFKLFLGSFLSLVLSWFVFLIPNSEFDAKTNLSVGAIFGAVGNKYFVDSAISSQVLTIADLINNLVITIVILNVLLIIYQKNQKVKSKVLSNEKTALKISVAAFVFCLVLILIFTR